MHIMTKINICVISCGIILYCVTGSADTMSPFGDTMILQNKYMGTNKLSLKYFIYCLSSAQTLNLFTAGFEVHTAELLRIRVETWGYTDPRAQGYARRVINPPFICNFSQST